MPKQPPTQVFQGYSGPNFTPIPDQLFDEQLASLGGAELKVLLYIMRRTFGFKKQRDNISLNQICRGITTREGVILDHGTGLSQSTVQTALKGLVARNIILAIRNSSPERGNEPTTYILNVADPFTENRQRGVPKIGKGLHRKSAIQETVVQETVVQPSNLRMASQQQARGSEDPPHERAQRAVGMPETIGSVLARRRRQTTSINREASQAIASAIREFANEFGDRAPLKSSVSRAVNLLRQTKTPLAAFISTLYEARAITRERTAPNGNGARAKNRMGYFFAVLEDLLGLKVPAGDND